MLESLPRSLKIGDSFTLFAQIFKTEKEVQNAILSVKSQKGLIQFDKSSQSVEFGESMSKDIVLEANVSNSNIGMKTLEFELKTKDYTYKDKVQIDIKALNPYSYENNMTLVLPQLYLDQFSTNFDKQKAINNINTAIERIALFQTTDGGFAYWSAGKDSNLWDSNYAGMFLILAKQNGYYVPEGLYQRWLKYEQEFVRRDFTDDKYGLNVQRILCIY